MASPDPSLGPRAARASAWSGADAVVRALLGFAITVVLARLVAPAEFGIVAMILVFSAIANVFIDSGLGVALIQRQDTTRVDESTAFYFNLGMSAVMALVLALAAPWIARFFAQPTLTGIARLMAVNLVIGALGSIHTTLLTKEMHFRPLLFIGLWSWGLSGALAIFLAWQGYGAWSLAWQVVAQTGISTLLLWTWHRWRPLARFSRDSLSRLFGFGGHVMAANLIDTVYMRLYSVFIGKLFSASDLGYYTRAQSTQQLPTNLLASMLNRVALPAFSRTADQPARLAAALAKTSRLLMFVNLPLMAGMAVTAHPLVQGLFGTRWLPAVPLLQVLCIVGALWPLQVLNVSALLAQGQSRLVLRIEVLKKALGVIALVIASPYGLLAIAWSQVLTSVLGFAINTHYSGRFLDFGGLAQLGALGRTFLATALMLTAVAFVQPHLHLHPLGLLALVVPLGALVYLGTSLLLGGSQLHELLRQLRPEAGA